MTYLRIVWHSLLNDDKKHEVAIDNKQPGRCAPSSIPHQGHLLRNGNQIFEAAESYQIDSAWVFNQNVFSFAYLS